MTPGPKLATTYSELGSRAELLTSLGGANRAVVCDLVDVMSTGATADA